MLMKFVIGLNDGDETEQCFGGGNLKGHIKNNTVMEIVNILFYVIDNNDQAKKIRWIIDNFELSSSHTEEELIESLKDTVLKDTPAARIIDWEVT